MSKIIFILAMVGLAGCADQVTVTETVTCPKENYTVSNSTSLDGKTYPDVGRNEVQEEWYVGRRCLNCGGIHNPKPLFRDKSGNYFVIKLSSEIVRRNYK